MELTRKSGIKRNNWGGGVHWLPRLGSNQEFQLQRLTCYHYTTGQSLHPIVIAPPPRVKGATGNRGINEPRQGNTANEMV